jgi:hypothetical protein
MTNATKPGSANEGWFWSLSFPTVRASDTGLRASNVSVASGRLTSLGGSTRRGTITFGTSALTAAIGGTNERLWLGLGK